MDGWLAMLNRYGSELHNCPKMIKSHFLDIIPKDLKEKIRTKKHLRSADHLQLIEWCRDRCETLLTQNLVDVERKNLAREFNLKGRGGRVNAVKHSEDEHDEVIDKSPTSDLTRAVELLTKNVTQIIAAVKPPSPLSAARPERGERGRDRTRTGRDAHKSPRQSPGRSDSPSRFFVAGWGRKCNHCGSDQHLKKDCKDFDKMMRDANVGVAKDKWKPPAGYKSALGKARDEARKKSPGRAASPGRVASVVEEDTASDSEYSDNDSVRFSMRALKPVKRGTPMARAHICALRTTNSSASLGANVNVEHANRFSELSDGSSIDDEAVQSLNSWATAVNAHPESQGDRKRRSKMVVVRSEKDVEKLMCKMAALPLDRKGLSKTEKKIIQNQKIECENDEIIAMLDSGSFTHAMDAEQTLPLHKIAAPGPRENRRKAETACGGILKILGTLVVDAKVSGHDISVKLNHMKVNTPILSVRKLVKDGHEVYICDGGGYIRNLATNKNMYFFEHQGGSFLKLKVGDAAGFGRH